MRTLIEDIMYGRRRDAASAPVRFILRFLSILYGIAVSARNYLYSREILKSRQVPCRVVCIGNLTAGGTGKTPVVIMSARMLKENGIKVAVVSRGYGRADGKTLVVSDGSRILPASESGDEPHLIASSLPGVPVVVGRNRFLAAMTVFNRFQPAVILLDDGFQHRGLYRDVDILTMDAGNPIGSDYLLPRGLLRESPRGMKRARAIVFTRADDSTNRERAERMVRYYTRNTSLFRTRIEAAGLREPGSERREEVTALAGQKVAALSNVVNPESFYKLLENAGAEIITKRAMPDHHRYSSAEIGDIVRETRSRGAGYLVMTAKDERNFPPEPQFNSLNVRVLDIRAALMENEQDYLTLLYPYGKHQAL